MVTNRLKALSLLLWNYYIFALISVNWDHQFKKKRVPPLTWYKKVSVTPRGSLEKVDNRGNLRAFLLGRTFSLFCTNKPESAGAKRAEGPSVTLLPPPTLRSSSSKSDTAGGLLWERTIYIKSYSNWVWSSPPRPNNRRIIEGSEDVRERKSEDEHGRKRQRGISYIACVNLASSNVPLMAFCFASRAQHLSFSSLLAHVRHISNSL